LIPIAAAIAGLTTGAGAAIAGTGGMGGGGLTIPDPTMVKDVVCIRDCGGLRKVTEGSRVEFTGQRLDGAKSVRFPGEQGPVEGKIVKRAKKTLVAEVPRGAADGRPKVIDALDRATKAPYKLKVVNAIPRSDKFELKEATATPRNSFFFAKQKTKLKYRFAGPGRTDVRIEVVNRDTGETVRRLVKESEPNTENVFQWNGMTNAGKAAKEGRYSFRIGPSNGGVASDEDARFALRGHMFPVRAPHNFGDGYGAGRGHQGVDIFARCGKPIVAARGGKVIYRSYQASAAGHYIVISGKGTKRDYMYAHLKRRSPLRPGTKVKTGQRIGLVGETGNASGCHLHFEIWKGRWWGGGKPVRQVKRIVREWDRWS
jgi:murein DD-endopeptidase MepM/ murein hydrolase activator NlpD